MVNSIRQHRPAYFGSFEDQTAEFDTKEELFAIPFVKNFSELPNFHQFSIDDLMLLAEYDNGKKWWVVGYLKQNLDLPKWTPKF